jgi:hypothetical protein
MLTQSLLLGMNLVTLIGFAVILLAMRVGRPTIIRRSIGSRRFVSFQRVALSTALMVLGSVLVIWGIYLKAGP